MLLLLLLPYIIAQQQTLKTKRIKVFFMKQTDRNELPFVASFRKIACINYECFEKSECKIVNWSSVLILAARSIKKIRFEEFIWKRLSTENVCARQRNLNSAFNCRVSTLFPFRANIYAKWKEREAQSIANDHTEILMMRLLIESICDCM